MAYDQALQALADSTRRSVFEAIAVRPRAVGELARDFPVSRPAISQHLRVLKEAGLIEASRDGTRNIYAVRREGLADLRAYLDRFWDETLDRYRRYVEQEEEK